MDSTQEKTECLAWHSNADKLADWAADRLVQRADAWGAYGQNGVYTGKEQLRRPLLLQHFRATERTHVIGAHSGSKGPNSTAKWVALDIDAHSEADNPERNWKTAQHFWDKAAEWNLSVLLTDSDGKGGYHFRILFSSAIPLHIAHAFAHWFFEHEDELTKGEIFPKQSALTAEGDGSYGNWLRIPGRHHNREHWSRVWSGTEWFSGVAAVQAILDAKTNDPTPILEWYAAHEAERQAEEEARRKAYEESQQKPSGNPGDEPDRHKKYGQAALKRQCGKVAAAGKGSRHHILRDAAFSLGHLVPNYLDKSEIQAALEDAVKVCGAENVKLAQKTITTGIDKGAKNPKPCLPPMPKIIFGSGTITTSKPSDWPEPIPLSGEPSVPEFPIKVFPPDLRDYVSKLAWALNAAIDFVGITILTLAAGMIGNSRRLRLSSTHEQPALIYAAMIGLPGTVKSPVLKITTKPLDEIQSNHNKDYLRQVEEWNKRKDDGIDAAELGEKPQLRLVIARNATTESLALSHHYNPRGFVCPLDELAALFIGMNQYKGGSGNDRQFYLSTWAQETINILRKNDLRNGLPPIFVSNPCISIIGGIQPDLLASIRGSAPRRGEVSPDDGGLDRFLFVWPPTQPAVADEGREVDQGVLSVWPIVVHHLTTELGDDETINLSPTARLSWQAFTRDHANEVNGPDFPEHLRGPWAKMQAYAGRLTLVLHMLKQGCGEIQESVSPDTVDDAAELIRYFKAHTRKVHACIDSDPRMKPAKMLLKWIVKGQRLQFSKRDAHQSIKGTIKQVDALDPILDLLERHSIIRSQDDGSRQGRGRPSIGYDVNPAVLFGNFENTENRSHSGGEREKREEDVFLISIAQNSQYSQKSSSDDHTPLAGETLWGAGENAATMRH